MGEEPKYCHTNFGDEKSFYFDHVHIFWNEQITFHQSVDWELSYVIRGSGTRMIGETVETFSSGEVIFIPPNIPHGWSFSAYDHDREGKIENITIIFPTALLEKMALSFPETNACISKIREFQKAVSFQGQPLRAIQNSMVSMTKQNDMEQLSSLMGLFQLIATSDQSRIVGFVTRQNKSTAKMQEVSRYMITNFQHKISLDEVALYVGMNRSSFCTFFKREKGKSFFTFLNEYRIDCSCLMLRETEKSIADICYAVGFDDIPYFNRTFKKLKGETPKDYRTKHQLQAE